MSGPHYLTIEKSARYYLSGPREADYHTLCFALHGYGQLGQYFIRNFANLQTEGVLFVAPEGFHRFYLGESKRRVGASWMTKEDRLTDIDDYCRYLDQVHQHFEDKVEQAQRVGVLGFSQGVATACRWLAASSNSFDFLINWAGVFPPDLKVEQALERTKQTSVHMLLGDEDEYIKMEDFREEMKLWEARGFELETRYFKGTHKMYKEVLDELLQSRIIG